MDRMSLVDARDILLQASRGDPPEDGRELTEAMRVGAVVIDDVIHINLRGYGIEAREEVG